MALFFNHFSNRFLTLFWWLILAGFNPLHAWSIEGPEDPDPKTVTVDTLGNRTKISSEFFSEFYLHYTLEHVLENFYELSFYQVETTGDFSHPDRFTGSFAGNSYQWNKFYYRKHRFNDYYLPGSSLHKPYLFHTDLYLDQVTSEIEFVKKDSPPNHIFTQWNHGAFGDRIPGADEIFEFIHGHSSGFENAFIPIQERKQIRNSGTIYFDQGLQLGQNKYNQSGYLTLGSRDQVQFNYSGATGTFKEDFTLVHLGGALPSPAPSLFDQSNYMFSYFKRDNLFSEFYYGPQETADYESINFSFWLDKFNNPEFFRSTGFNLSKKNIDLNDPTFSRNLIDQDGEGFEPWYPSASVWEISLHHKQKFPVHPHFNLKFESFNGIIQHNPTQSGRQNPVFSQTSDTTFVPLHVINWENSSFTSGILENRAGIEYIRTFGSKFYLRAGIDLTFDGIIYDSDNFLKVSNQFNLNLAYNPSPKWLLKLDFGKQKIPFSFDQIRFLSPNYFSGDKLYWDDQNGNESFEQGEAGGLFVTTGGRYHSLGSDLKQPSIFNMDLTIDFKLNNNWTFSMINQFRQYKNTWTTEFVDPVDQVGNFLTVGQRDDLFFFNGGQQVNYRVVPFKTELMEAAAQKELSSLFNQPFMGGTTLKVRHETPRIFFQTSFNAYMVVGFGPLGNGVIHNNLGVLSETSANPNLYINYLGRLDADRAFIIRSYVGYKILKNLRFGFQLTWKDGQPFNLFETAADPTAPSNQNQLTIFNNGIKGINPFTDEFGSRESAYWNFDLRLNYEAKIWSKAVRFQFNVYNLLDMGTTLSNYAFSPTGVVSDRFVLDVQIPRGFMLSVDYLF